jgi:hypothetical protein
MNTHLSNRKCKGDLGEKKLHSILKYYIEVMFYTMKLELMVFL